MSEKLKKCIICGGRVFKDYSEKVVRCEGCSLVVAKEIPTLKEIDDIYQKEYFFGKEYINYKADRFALEWNFKGRIKSLGHMIKPGDKIIEIGCAYGYFLNLVKDKVASHTGFDVTKDGVEHAKKQFGLNATTEDFIKYDIKDNSVDNVFMWDVIEHLVHPDEYIEKIARVLKTGGRLALTTGDVDALLSRIQKGKWRMIHPPTHIYYFNPKTIRLLLQKYGLAIETTKYHSVNRNVDSIFNMMIGNKKARKENTKFYDFCYSLAKKMKLDKMNVPINTFDIMQVVARKI